MKPALAILLLLMLAGCAARAAQSWADPQLSNADLGKLVPALVALVQAECRPESCTVEIAGGDTGQVGAALADALRRAGSAVVVAVASTSFSGVFDRRPAPAAPASADNRHARYWLMADKEGVVARLDMDGVVITQFFPRSAQGLGDGRAVARRGGQ